MPAPPSRESWVWQLAARALEHCTAVGSRVSDLEVSALPLEGVTLVSVSDGSLKRRGIPKLVASAAIPDADAQIEQEVRAAIEHEESRLGRVRVPHDG